MVSMFLLIFIMLIFMFFGYYYSFLSSLLYLESISLVLFFGLMCNLFSFFSLGFLFFYFVFVVCESSLGLSILISSIKFYGKSNFKSMNIFLF